MSTSRQARTTFIRYLLMLVVLIGSAIWVGTSQATPGAGVVAQLLSQGDLPQAVPITVRNKGLSKQPIHTDVTRIQTYKITIPPGAYSGWHQHGGPHIIVVESGTLTYFVADDPTCTGVLYPAGSSIFDPGFTTHFARNDGTVDVVTSVTQLLPVGGVFRIDASAPTQCGF